MYCCSLLLGPFKNYPQITVYHPNVGNGYPFINIGWSGWVGSITGRFIHSPYVAEDHCVTFA